MGKSVIWKTALDTTWLIGYSLGQSHSQIPYLSNNCKNQIGRSMGSDKRSHVGRLDLDLGVANISSQMISFRWVKMK